MKKICLLSVCFLISAFFFLQAVFACEKYPCISMKDALQTDFGKYGYAIKDTGQIVVVLQTKENHYGAVALIERTDNDKWMETATALPAEIGRNGIAKFGEKVEGDGKTPSGVYPLSMVFGYDERVETKMPYRQATEKDYWIDDVEHPNYNKWVQDLEGAKSYELMRRKDDLYKFGIVVDYNVKPVVKAKGSAIFFHIWRDQDKPTAGCIALSEENLLKIIKWLDPKKKPVALLVSEE